MELGKRKKTTNLTKKLFTPQVNQFKESRPPLLDYLHLKSNGFTSLHPRKPKKSLSKKLKPKSPKPNSTAILVGRPKVGKDKTFNSITPLNKTPKSINKITRANSLKIKFGKTLNRVNLKTVLKQKSLEKKLNTIVKNVGLRRQKKKTGPKKSPEHSPFAKKHFNTGETQKNRLNKLGNRKTDCYVDNNLWFSKNLKMKPIKTNNTDVSYRQIDKENLPVYNKMKTEVNDNSSTQAKQSKKPSLMFSNFFKKKEGSKKHINERSKKSQDTSVFIKTIKYCDLNIIFDFYEELKDFKQSFNTKSQGESAKIDIDRFFELDKFDIILSCVNSSDEIGKDILWAVKITVYYVILIINFSCTLSVKLDLYETLDLLLANFDFLFSALDDYFSSYGLTKQLQDLNNFKKESSVPILFQNQEINSNLIKKRNEQLNINFDKIIDLLFDETKKKEILSLKANIKQQSLLTCYKACLDIYDSSTSSYLLSESTVSISVTKEQNLSITNIYDEENEPYFIFQPLKTESFLPAKAKDEKAYTLVLDLDETLVHFQESEQGGQFLVRPFAQDFIKKMAEKYELIIFTAAVQEYADWILDRIDAEGYIKYRLYRRHTMLQDNVYIKDLSKINRDITKTMIVDNSCENFKLQPSNGIYIKSWYDDPNDLALRQLSKVLSKLVADNPEDVRIALKNLQRKIILQNSQSE